MICVYCYKHHPHTWVLTNYHPLYQRTWHVDIQGGGRTHESCPLGRWVSTWSCVCWEAWIDNISVIPHDNLTLVILWLYASIDVLWDIFCYWYLFLSYSVLLPWANSVCRELTRHTEWDPVTQVNITVKKL